MNNEQNIVVEPMSEHIRSLIRVGVRGSYDIQKLRISTGNRITGIFKKKLGMTSDGMSERELAAQDKRILDTLRASYARITDGIIIEGTETIEEGKKRITPKKFKGDDTITSFEEFALVRTYMNLLKTEEDSFANLGKVLEDVPIYKHFLKGVEGCGIQMAAVIVSEIDITKARYASSVWAYAGLDVITVGVYTDDNGVEHVVKPSEIEEFYASGNTSCKMYVNGHQVKFREEGRSRKQQSLVKREYITRDGKPAVRDSITFNPFLKTKLIGVLGGAFLKAGGTRVNGDKMSAARRMALAIELGYEGDKKDQEASDQFLIDNGYSVEFVPTSYGRYYYEKRTRYTLDPFYSEHTQLHRHNMAMRYTVQRFLADLYREWRKLEGLPVAVEYAEAKLGLKHHSAEGKEITKPWLAAECYMRDLPTLPGHNTLQTLGYDD